MMSANNKPGSIDRQGGFTLIELLVVLMILGLLAGLVGPKVLKYLGGAKSDTAELQIAEFGVGLDLFHLEVGRYPTTEEGLLALVAKPTGIENWQGPYFKKHNIPSDPWGNSYHYQYPGATGEYDLFSLGRDNANGGSGVDGDVVSW
jgi:general secretion pathway protein G